MLKIAFMAIIPVTSSSVFFIPLKRSLQSPSPSAQSTEGAGVTTDSKAWITCSNPDRFLNALLRLKLWIQRKKNLE